MRDIYFFSLRPVAVVRLVSSLFCTNSVYMNIYMYACMHTLRSALFLCRSLVDSVIVFKNQELKYWVKCSQFGFFFLLFSFSISTISVLCGVEKIFFIGSWIFRCWSDKPDPRSLGGFNFVFPSRIYSISPQIAGIFFSFILSSRIESFNKVDM